MPTHMADIRCDWLTNQNTDWCFVVIGLVGWQSHSPLLQLKIDPVRQMGPPYWLAASKCQRIFINIRGQYGIQKNIYIHPCAVITRSWDHWVATSISSLLDHRMVLLWLFTVILAPNINIATVTYLQYSGCAKIVLLTVVTVGLARLIDQSTNHTTMPVSLIVWQWKWHFCQLVVV